MCRKESWGAIAVPMEAYSTQRVQPCTENARAWLVEVRVKGTKSNPRSIERRERRPLVSGWDSKDPGGRPEQDPADTSRPGQQYGI